jgi:hypothetical protein
VAHSVDPSEREAETQRSALNVFCPGVARGAVARGRCSTHRASPKPSREASLLGAIGDPYLGHAVTSTQILLLRNASRGDGVTRTSSTRTVTSKRVRVALCRAVIHHYQSGSLTGGAKHRLNRRQRKSPPMSISWSELGKPRRRSSRAKR